MDWTRVEGNWKEYRGKLKERWAQLTDDDLKTIAGKRDQLIGKLQAMYGMAKEEAEREVREFLAGLGTSDDEERSRSDWTGHSAGTH